MISLLPYQRLLQLIPRKKVLALILKWQTDKGTRCLGTERFIFLLFASLIFSRSSLREIELSFGVARSTFDDALRKRPVGFFEDFFQVMLFELLKVTRQRKERLMLKEVLALDSSTCRVHGSLKRFSSWRMLQQQKKSRCGLKLHLIWNVGKNWVEDALLTGARRNDVCIAKHFKIKKDKIYVFDRGYVDLNFWLKITQAKSDFVTRLKHHGKRLRYIHESLSERLNGTGVLHDGLWHPSDVSCYRQGVHFKEICYRHIIYRDPESKKLFDFLTSNFTLSAEQIALIYRQRWAVELSFRWFKEHLNMRELSLRNKNGLGIQMMMSMILQVLLRMRMQKEKLHVTTWELLRSLRTLPERVFFETLLRQGSPPGYPAKTFSQKDFAASKIPI